MHTRVNRLECSPQSWLQLQKEEGEDDEGEEKVWLAYKCCPATFPYYYYYYYLLLLRERVCLPSPCVLPTCPTP